MLYSYSPRAELNFALILIALVGWGANPNSLLSNLTRYYFHNPF
jgi:hypothetical protein